MSKTTKSKTYGYRFEMIGHLTPSGSDLAYLIDAGLRGLVRLRPRKAVVHEATRTGQDPDALRRYPMDAGIPGRVTLLLDRSDPRRRRWG